MSDCVAVGAYALQASGLTAFYPDAIQQTTGHPRYDRWFFKPMLLYYLPDINDDHRHIEGSVRTFYSNLLFPTAERAIVDNIRHQDIFEEFYLVDALKRYLYKHGEDLDKLREVAAEYGQSEQLEYWIQEALDDYDE